MNGLLVVPTFEDIVGEQPLKLDPLRLPGVELLNDPFVTGFIDLQNGIETEAEFQQRQAQLEALLKRVSRDYRVPVAQVREMTRDMDRQGLFEGTPPPPPPPPPGGERARRRRTADDDDISDMDTSGPPPPPGPPPPTRSSSDRSLRR